MSDSPSDPSASVRRDSALMSRIGAGDVAAFQEVMAGNGRRLLRLAYGIVGRLDEAEDIVQEAMLGLWQAAPEWQARATAAAYLRTLVTRKAIDVLRRRKKQAGEAVWDTLRDPGKSPEEQLAASQDRDLVQYHLGLLPERQRAALALSHFEQLSHQEAAEVLDMKVEAFASLLARARRSLRHSVEQADTHKEFRKTGKEIEGYE